MQINKYFDLKRFWLLIKLELYRSRKGILMTIVIMFGLLFFIGLLFTAVVDPNLVVYEHSGSYVSSLLIGGFILTSLAFSDLSNTLRSYHYLTLPVSTFERFFCMWLLTTIGWIILFTIAYTIYTFFANIVGQLLFRQIEFISFRPWNMLVFAGIKYYVVTQGIFLVGAVKFKGYVFPKTLVTLVVSAFVVMFIMYVFMWDMTNLDPGYFEDPSVWTDLPIYKVWEFLQGMFWWALAPLCWVVTYLALKEREV